MEYQFFELKVDIGQLSLKELDAFHRELRELLAKEEFVRQRKNHYQNHHKSNSK